VNEEVVKEGKENLQDILREFCLEDVFNADETGFFFRALPDVSLTTRRVAGGKSEKERVTVMLTVSATGRKLKPWVIGRSANPRCFRNANVSNYGIVYRWV